MMFLMDILYAILAILFMVGLYQIVSRKSNGNQTGLAAMFEGMGDSAVVAIDGNSATIRHEGLRIARGLTDDGRRDLLACWTELWKGCVASHRAFMDVTVAESGDGLDWRISASG